MLSALLVLVIFGDRISHFTQASLDCYLRMLSLLLLLGWQAYTTMASFFH
jgi:hypothetical protein